MPSCPTPWVPLLRSHPTSSCFAAAAADEGSPTQTAFALIGKLFAAANFALVYIITAELFPTYIRTTAIGLCSLFARLGGIIAPQLALLLPSLTAPYVPLLTFGLVSLLGSALAFALPETAGHQLPDSFAEVDAWGKGRPFWSWNLSR